MTIFAPSQENTQNGFIMSNIIDLKKGLNIPVSGVAAPKTRKVAVPGIVAVKPTDFRGLKPRLLVKEGDKVLAGSPVLADKESPDILFTSPVSGTVTEVVRGEKRKLLEVRIKADNSLSADGTLTGTFTISAEGQSDSNIRRIFTTGWQSDWKRSMESQLLAVSPNARLLGVDWGKDPKDYQAAPIKITFRYEIPGYALKGDGELLFKPMVMNNLYNQVKSYLRIDTGMEERRYGFKDSCSRLVELDETVQLPDGYVIVDHKTHPAEFDAERYAASCAPQLRLYRRAVEAATGKPVKQTIIHLPMIGRCYEVE